MIESFDEYRERVLGYLGNCDPIKVQQATASKLKSLISRVDPKVLTKRPKPDKWSIVEIIIHMADAELAMAWRIRNMFATPGVELQWFDQDIWANVLEYGAKDPIRSIELFKLLRESNLELLLSVPRESWDLCFGIHQVRGRQTVSEFVELEAAHDLSHIRQIEQILESANKE